MPEDEKPEETEAPAETAAVNVHVHTGDDDKKDGGNKILLTLIGILGTIATIFVGGWVNWRFNTQEQAAANTTEQIEHLEDAVDDLTTLLERVGDHDERANQLARTELAHMRMIVVRLERIMLTSEARQILHRHASEAFDDIPKNIMPAELEELGRVRRDRVLELARAEIQDQMQGQSDEPLDPEVVRFLEDEYDEMIQEQVQVQRELYGDE